FGREKALFVIERLEGGLRKLAREHRVDGAGAGEGDDAGADAQGAGAGEGRGTDVLRGAGDDERAAEGAFVRPWRARRKCGARPGRRQHLRLDGVAVFGRDADVDHLDAARVLRAGERVQADLAPSERDRLVGSGGTRVDGAGVG